MPCWKWWCGLLVLLFIFSWPIIFLLMHYLVYIGNLEGDFPIDHSGQFHYTAEDGKTLLGLEVPVPAAPTLRQAPVIFFGGNAQGMSGAATDALALFNTMFKQHSLFQFQVYSTAYRGYSPNNGWTSQAALRSDTQKFLDHVLRSTNSTHEGRVILAGWSMGAGVAMQLAAARPEKIAGLLLFSPWSTLREEILDIAAPVSHLLQPYVWMADLWDSVAEMASLPKEIPVAVLSPDNDQVIKRWQHRKLFDACRAFKKWFLPTPMAEHQDLVAEILAHADALGNWTQAAWDRVGSFEPSTADVALQATMVSGRTTFAESHGRGIDMENPASKAYDLFAELPAARTRFPMYSAGALVV